MFVAYFKNARKSTGKPKLLGTNLKTPVMLPGMTDFATVISDFRKRFKLSKTKAAEVLGVNRNTITSIEQGVDISTGLPFSPREGTLRQFAERMTEFGYPMTYERLALATGTLVLPRVEAHEMPGLIRAGVKATGGSASEAMRLIGSAHANLSGNVVLPRLGPTAAGDLLSGPEETSDTVSVPAGWALGADAVFRVRGNSLSARRVLDGDDLLVARIDGARPTDGSLVILAVEGAYVARIYRRNEIGEYLESHEVGSEPRPHTYPEGSQLVGRIVRWMIEP